MFGLCAFSSLPIEQSKIVATRNIKACVCLTVFIHLHESIANVSIDELVQLQFKEEREREETKNNST